MEYVEGRDLMQMLAAGHRFRPSEAARIAADVAVEVGAALAEQLRHPLPA